MAQVVYKDPHVRDNFGFVPCALKTCKKKAAERFNQNSKAIEMRMTSPRSDPSVNTSNNTCSNNTSNIIKQHMLSANISQMCKKVFDDVLNPPAVPSEAIFFMPPEHEFHPFQWSGRRLNAWILLPQDGCPTWRSPKSAGSQNAQLAHPPRCCTMSHSPGGFRSPNLLRIRLQKF